MNPFHIVLAGVALALLLLLALYWGTGSKR